MRSTKNTALGALTLTVLVSLLAPLALSGCEGAAAKCESGKDDLRRALQGAATGANAATRQTDEARRSAMDALGSSVMDLGNLRSDAVVAALGNSDDGAVGVEVSVGAMMAALLAVDHLAEADPEMADRIATAAREELEGRYRELMTLNASGEGAGARLAEIGDGCSTDLQLLVQEVPDSAKARIHGRFEALVAEEAPPDASLTYARMMEAATAYDEARAAAATARSDNDHIVAALDALSGPASGLSAAFDALPDDVDLGEAGPRSAAIFAACAESE